MKRIRDRVAGLDVHRDSVVVCARTIGPDGDTVLDRGRFRTTTAGLGQLAGFLLDHEVRTVVMEATGVYWKPVYYSLEGLFPELWLVNAQHVKNVPGRKTDVSDAEWLADVAAHGMVRPSLVPPPPIRELRDLTRYRRKLTDERAREIKRLEKVLQDATIKITSVASRVWTKSSRDMVEAMIAGQRDPAALADLARGRLRDKIPALTEALDGRFSEHHARMAARIISHIDFLDASIAELTEQIAQAAGPFEAAITILESIPGISRTIAEIVIAETGGDMSAFPTAQHLCSWAGLAPGNRESAGKSRPAGTTRGSNWLRTAMIESARAAARTKGTFFNARYEKVKRRRGPNKAAVAIARSQMTAIWHMLNDGTLYDDPGADYYTRRQDPEALARQLTRKIENLGYTVTIQAA